MPHPRKHTTETVTVVHSPTMRNAEDWKRQVLMPYFQNKWEHFRLDDDDLRALQIMIMMRPKGPPIVPGTGGLRKIRFSRRDTNRGKSGSYRIGSGTPILKSLGSSRSLRCLRKRTRQTLPPDRRTKSRN